jgi:hypothetical protein
VGVYEVGQLPEELKGFVRFQAYHQQHVPAKEEKVAMLQIVGTTSYFPIFLNKVSTIEDAEAQLREADAVLDDVSKASMVRIFQEKNK